MSKQFGDAAKSVAVSLAYGIFHPPKLLLLIFFSQFLNQAELLKQTMKEAIKFAVDQVVP